MTTRKRHTPRPPCVKERTRHQWRKGRRFGGSCLLCPFCDTRLFFTDGPKGGTVEHAVAGAGSGESITWRWEGK